MADARITIELSGDKSLIRAIEKMRASAQGRITRSAITKASRLLAREAKARAPRAGATRDTTGLLRKSIGHVVRRTRGGQYYGVVGPRKDVVEGNRQPHKYAHFVERGTMRAQAKPFLRPAVDATKGAIATTMKTEMKAALEREIRRAKKRK